jgi:hypothetical protein
MPIWVDSYGPLPLWVNQRSGLPISARQPCLSSYEALGLLPEEFEYLQKGEKVLPAASLEYYIETAKI